MSEDRPLPRRPLDAAVPEQRLTPAEMEAVITRAIELQAREEERGGEEGIGAQELVRIAGELGLSASHVQQAIAEVRGKPAAEKGWMVSVFGETRVSTSRFVSIPAAAARNHLDRYLQEREAMVVQRRLPNRTVYERGSGVGAAVARATNMMGARHALLNARLLEVTVDPVDERSCIVALARDLTTERSGTVAGTAAGGLVGGAAAVSLGLTLAPPLALVGLPILGGFAYLMRSAHRRTVRKCEIQLESLLDRLEHGELVDRDPAGLLRRFRL